MLDNHDFPDRQCDYNFMIDETDCVDFIRKLGPELPATIDPVFDVKFDKTTHGAYLRKHLKIGHMLGSQAVRIIDLVKKH